MFELWCKRSYFLAERDNYIALKKRETVIQISEHFQALSIPSCMLYMSPSQMSMWLHAFAYCLVVNQPFWKQKKLASSVSCWIIYNKANFICPREIKKFRIVVYRNWRLILNIIGLKVTTLICVLLL